MQNTKQHLKCANACKRSPCYDSDCSVNFNHFQSASKSSNQPRSLCWTASIESK